MADERHKFSSERDDARRKAREACAKEWNRQAAFEGRPESYESTYRKVCERADMVDKKKDRG